MRFSFDGVWVCRRAGGTHVLGHVVHSLRGWLARPGTGAARRAASEADAKALVERAVLDASQVERPRVRTTARDLEVAHGRFGADRKRSFATGIR
jgi:hypothetical protein